MTASTSSPCTQPSLPKPHFLMVSRMVTALCCLKRQLGSEVLLETSWGSSTDICKPAQSLCSPGALVPLGIPESFRLEETPRIIESSLWLIPTSGGFWVFLGEPSAQISLGSLAGSTQAPAPFAPQMEFVLPVFAEPRGNVAECGARSAGLWG